MNGFRRPRLRVLVTAVLVALVAAACSGDGGDGDDGGDGGDETASATESDDSADDTPSDDGDTAADAAGEDEVGIALILKNTSNPFFVSMEESAQEAAEECNVSLSVAAGQEDGDTETQIRAIEDAIARGDAGILITPSGDAVVPALEQAREAGLFELPATPPTEDATMSLECVTSSGSCDFMVRLTRPPQPGGSAVGPGTIPGLIG